MMLRGGSQNTGIARKILLAMRRHNAAQRQVDFRNLNVVSDFERSADPFVLDEP